VARVATSSSRERGHQVACGVASQTITRAQLASISGSASPTTSRRNFIARLMA
jgi:hypothetical protein